MNRTSVLASVICFLVAAAVSVALTPVARLVALRYGWVDEPAPPVKNHGEGVAYLGGLAICVAWLIGLLVGSPLAGLEAAPMRGLVPGVVALMLLGLLDDIRPLSAGLRLAVELVVAVCMVANGIRLDSGPLDGWAGALVSVLWLVGITNAFNFLDVADGVAAGVAVAIGGALAVMALAAACPVAMLVSAAIAGAALGFLRYNCAPARIYMGDAGSYMLGLGLGAAGLLAVKGFDVPVALPALALIMVVPLVEVVLVIVLRLRRGASILKASPDHLALRLAAWGLGKAHVVLVLSVCSVVAAIIGVTMLLRFEAWPSILGVTTIMGCGSVYLLCRRGMSS